MTDKFVSKLNVYLSDGTLVAKFSDEKRIKRFALALGVPLESLRVERVAGSLSVAEKANKSSVPKNKRRGEKRWSR